MNIEEPTIEQIYFQVKEYFSRPDATLAMDNRSGRCYYRDSSGNKCAVGCLIPDDKYDIGMEGTDAYDLMTDWFDWSISDTLRFLTRIQKAHDSSPNVPQFLKRLDSLYQEEISS